MKLLHRLDISLRHCADFCICLYQKMIRPVLPSCCRYHPSCSDYARSAFTHYSFFKALGFSVLRLLRCNPFFPGGIDHLKD